jgi:hypothetical protein
MFDVVIHRYTIYGLQDITSNLTSAANQYSVEVPHNVIQFKV